MCNISKEAAVPFELFSVASAKPFVALFHKCYCFFLPFLLILDVTDHTEIFLTYLMWILRCFYDIFVYTTCLPLYTHTSMPIQARLQFKDVDTNLNTQKSQRNKHKGQL